MEELINFLVNGVCTCAVVITGTILNCVAINIIWKKYDRSNIFYQMLIRLLYCDICVLVTWLNLSLFVAFKLNNDVILHMVPYFSYPSTHIAITASTFMTVAIAHERYLAIRDPLKYSEGMKTPNVQSNRLKIYLFLVIAIAVAFNIPHFLDLEIKYVDLSLYTNSTKANLTHSNSTELSYSNEDNSTIPNTTNDTDQIISSNVSTKLLTPMLGYSALGRHPYYLKYYRNIVRLIVSGIIPFVLLIFFNITIYKAIRKNVTRRRTFSTAGISAQQRLTSMTQTGRNSICNSSIRTGTRLVAPPKRKDDENLSMVFVVIVTAFLFCHSLKFVLNFYDGFFGKVGATSWSRIAGYFSNFLVVLNSSINTIIYCIMNTKFRNHFLRAMKSVSPCIRRNVERTNPQIDNRAGTPECFERNPVECTVNIEMNHLIYCETHL